MKVLIAATIVLALSSSASAKAVVKNSPHAGLNAVDRRGPQVKKTSKTKPGPTDSSSAAAPHVYPPTAAVKPQAQPLNSNANSQAGTVHKDAPLDQIGGAGG